MTSGAVRRGVRPGTDAASAVIHELDAFLDEVVAPLESDHAELLGDHAGRYDRSGILTAPLVELQRQVRMRAASAGVYGLMVPTELGGRGLDPIHQYEVWEHLYGRSGPDRLLPYESVGRFTSGPGAALRGMSPEVRRDVWPAVLSGETLLCFALSEAGAHRTPAVRTRAVPAPGGYRLTGTKRWVSRGGYADFALVYAVAGNTPPVGPAGELPPEVGPTAFLVRLTEPGVHVRGATRILGRAGGEEVTLEFDGVEVALDQIVGELHHGEAVARSGAFSTAVFTAGRFVGLARWALERTRSVVESGRAMMDAIEAERLLADGLIEWRKMDFLARRGVGLPTTGDQASALRLVQVLAPSMCGRVYEAAMRIEGAEALSNEARLFDGWHQAMIVKVAQSRIEGVAMELEERLRRKRRQGAR